jgi:hypothetical protein
MAAGLNLKSGDIAPLTYFVRDFFDYLCFLPDEAIGRLRTLFETRIRRTEDIQKHVLDKFAKPLIQKVSEGLDICLTDEQLKILSIIGIPITACTNKKNADELKTTHGIGSFPFCIFSCGEVNNELNINATYLKPIKDKHICLPFLVLEANDVEAKFGTFYRGGNVAHYYHLLCVPEI